VLCGLKKKGKKERPCLGIFIFSESSYKRLFKAELSTLSLLPVTNQGCLWQKFTSCTSAKQHANTPWGANIEWCFYPSISRSKKYIWEA